MVKIFSLLTIVCLSGSKGALGMYFLTKLMSCYIMLCCSLPYFKLVHCIAGEVFSALILHSSILQNDNLYQPYSEKKEEDLTGFQNTGCHYHDHIVTMATTIVIMTLRH